MDEELKTQISKINDQYIDTHNCNKTDEINFFNLDGEEIYDYESDELERVNNEDYYNGKYNVQIYKDKNVIAIKNLDYIDWTQTFLLKTYEIKDGQIREINYLKCWYNQYKMSSINEEMIVHNVEFDKHFKQWLKSEILQFEGNKKEIFLKELNKFQLLVIDWGNPYFFYNIVVKNENQLQLLFIIVKWNNKL